MTDFHIRLKEVRIMRKKKLKEAAACLGIQVRSYQAYESGERETPAWVVVKLADFYGVSTDYLLGRTDVPAPYPPAKRK